MVLPNIIIRPVTYPDRISSELVIKANMSSIIDDQKQWLDQYRPLAASYILNRDFYRWKPEYPETVYRHYGMSELTGHHLTLIVGYDVKKEVWIMKNSWGSGWGTQGFVYFG
jgi:Cysteine protease